MANPPSKAERLRAEADMVDAEAAFIATKAKGQKRADKARAKAFDTAGTVEEFMAAYRAVPPAVSREVKETFHALRRTYREKYRTPVKPGEGAAPGTIGATAEPQVPG